MSPRFLLARSLLLHVPLKLTSHLSFLVAPLLPPTHLLPYVSALSAIPPFFGFASSLTFAGFTYGLARGIPIAFLGTLSGSSIAFFLYRYVFRKQFGKMMGTGANGGQGREGGKWEAFQAVVVSPEKRGKRVGEGRADCFFLVGFGLVRNPRVCRC